MSTNQRIIQAAELLRAFSAQNGESTVGLRKQHATEFARQCGLGDDTGKVSEEKIGAIIDASKHLAPPEQTNP